MPIRIRPRKRRTKSCSPAPPQAAVPGRADQKAIRLAPAVGTQPEATGEPSGAFSGNCWIGGTPAKAKDCGEMTALRPSKLKSMSRPSSVQARCPADPSSQRSSAHQNGRPWRTQRVGSGWIRRTAATSTSPSALGTSPALRRAARCDSAWTTSGLGSAQPRNNATRTNKLARRVVLMAAQRLR